jgi:hypothetical protein
MGRVTRRSLIKINKVPLELASLATIGAQE